MKTLKVISLSVLILIGAFSGVVYAECATSEECIDDYAMTGIGRINNTLRAVYFELKETNKILRKEGQSNGSTRR